MRNCKGYKMIE